MCRPSVHWALTLSLLVSQLACCESDGLPTVPPCGQKPGELRGKSTHKLEVAGLSRSFIYYAPSSLDANQPAAVVFVLHGYGMSAEQMFEITEYAALADRQGFVVMFPNGQDTSAPWNVGHPDCITTGGPLPLAEGDDDKFFSAMLTFAERDRCLDRKHIFLTGFSMGGYFANHAGCTRSDLRAIAPNAGGSHPLKSCASAHVPALVLHFEDDVVVPYACGTQARDRWLTKNGCDANDADVREVRGGSCAYYRGCPADGQVAMCSFTTPSGERTEGDRGHAWSGGSKEGEAGGGLYAIPETESATELSWEFFKRYAW